MVDGDAPGVPEVVVGDLLGMQLVDSDVDVQICLNIVTHLARPLELLPSSTHAVG